MRSATFHPLLFACAPILSLFAANQGHVILVELWLPLLAALLLVISSWVVCASIVRDLERSAVMASAIAVLYFSFGRALLVLEDRYLVGERPFEEALLLWVWAVLFALVCGALVKWRGLAGALRPILNAVAVTLFALPLLWIVGWQLRGASFDPETITGRDPVAANTPDERPDIYYIVLDGYGETQILRTLFGFDNRDFLEELEAAGFYVARRSLANYGQTHLSLASSLNLAYLDELAEQLGPQSTDRRPLADLIRDNRLMARLRAHGYAIHAFESGWAATQIRGADRYLTPGIGFTDFQNAVLNLTPIPLGLRWMGWMDLYDLHRRRVLFTLDKLAELPALPGPKFVFAHIISPHPPFVLDAEGGPLTPDRPFRFQDGDHFIESASRAEYVHGYAEQARFISRRIQSVVDSILADSARPPVIVLQGDHGPGSRLVQESIEQSSVPERMRILNAYHLPGGGGGALYPEITPVNTFRVILNAYLGDSSPLLEDRSFYSTWPHPYDFRDVTKPLRTLH
jgi:hypothetical protein